MSQNFATLVSALVVAVVLAAQASASTEVIIDDTYTGSAGTALTTHTPDANLPGGSYQIGNADLGIGGGTGGPSPGGVGLSASNYPINTADIARVGQDSSFGLSLSSFGAYTKPTTFTVSADLNLEGEEAGSGGSDVANVSDAGLTGGIALGFYDTSSDLGANRRGILGVVYSDHGSLLLVHPGIGGASNSIVVDAVVTTYDPDSDPIPLTGTHNLSYTVDTTSGAISNVTFDGFAINFGVTTTAFTDAATTFVGTYSRSGSSDDYGLLDNLEVTAQVPEPASMSLLAAGGVALLGLRRRRNGVRGR